MRIEVLITPERLDSILFGCLWLYPSQDQRMAVRGALMDAAVLCDALASKYLMQQREGKKFPSKGDLAIAAAFQRAGDEIMRMRERVDVNQKDDLS